MIASAGSCGFDATLGLHEMFAPDACLPSGRFWEFRLTRVEHLGNGHLRPGARYSHDVQERRPLKNLPAIAPGTGDTPVPSRYQRRTGFAAPYMAGPRFSNQFFCILLRDDCTDRMRANPFSVEWDVCAT